MTTCADRSGSASASRSSDYGRVRHGRDGGPENEYDAHGRSTVRGYQQGPTSAHPPSVAAREVRLARRAALVNVQHVHDAQSAAFPFSRLNEIPAYTNPRHAPLEQPSRTTPSARRAH